MLEYTRQQKHQNDRHSNHDLNTTIKKNSDKKTASHPSSLRKPSLRRELIDKLERAEVAIKQKF